MRLEACNLDALITTNPEYQVPKTVCNRDVGLDVDLVGVDRAAAAVHGKS